MTNINNEIRSCPVTLLLDRRSTRTGSRRALKAALVVLALLAAVQTVTLSLPMLGIQDHLQAISVGSDLSSISINHADGTVPSLGAGKPTLVLVFDPTCAHSRRIASEWSSWLDAAGLEEQSVLAISPGPLPEAISYAREADWPVQVGSVERDPSFRLSVALTQRTPWVFAVDGAGRVVAEGQGSELREMILARDRPPARASTGTSPAG